MDACKSQASARVDVPTAPMTLKYTIEGAGRGARLVAQQRGTLCGEAGERRRRSLRMESGHDEVGRGHLR